MSGIIQGRRSALAARPPAAKRRVPRLGAAAAPALALAAVTLVTACTGPASLAAARDAGRDTGARSAGTGAAALRYRYLTDAADGTLTKPYGYNLVDLGPYRSLIDALPAGQRALVWIGDYSHATCSFDRSDRNVRGALAAIATDPKVAGYYIADEADWSLPADGGHCPQVAAQVTARSRLVHRLAPGAFTYEVVTEPSNFAAFARATDVMGADPYPCLRGHPCDWGQIPAYIAALSAAHVARYWGVLQAFAYQQWRFPTPAELARMIRQWQRSRWQGEQTFAWSFGGQSLARHPGLLAVLAALNHAGMPAASRLSSSLPGSCIRRSPATSVAGLCRPAVAVEFATRRYAAGKAPGGAAVRRGDR